MPISKAELETVYRDLETSLYNFALRWVFDPALAEELVHEAFIRVWDRRDHVDLPTIKGLLFKTAQNLAINEIRKRKLRDSIPAVEWIWPSPRHTEAAAIAEQELAKMKRRLEQLPFEVREVILLSEFSEMSLEEIGRVLGIPAGTVASRKNRGMRILREGENHEKDV